MSTTFDAHGVQVCLPMAMRAVGESSTASPRMNCVRLRRRDQRMAAVERERKISVDVPCGSWISRRSPSA